MPVVDRDAAVDAAAAAAFAIGVVEPWMSGLGVARLMDLHIAARRRAEGLTTAEIIRCLKRYIAREIYQLLTNPPAVPNGADLRDSRNQAGLSLATAATELATSPITISRLERGLGHDTELATRYQHWLTQTAA